MRTICLVFSAGWALAVSCLTCGAMEVKCQVRETAQVARSPAVITTGVPFARGAVKDVGKLSVSIGGKAVAAH